MAISDRLYAINPQAYEAPSATEGLAQLLSVIDRYNERQDKKAIASEQNQLERERLEADKSLKERTLAHKVQQDEKLSKSQRLTELTTSYGSDHQALALALRADELLKDDPAYIKIAEQAETRHDNIAKAHGTLSGIYSNPNASSIEYQQAYQAVDWTTLPSNERNQFMMLHFKQANDKKAEEKAFLDEHPALKGMAQRIQMEAIDATPEKLQMLGREYDKLVNMATGAFEPFDYLSAPDDQKALYEKALGEQTMKGSLDSFLEGLENVESDKIETYLQSYITGDDTDDDAGLSVSWMGLDEAIKKYYATDVGKKLQIFK